MAVRAASFYPARINLRVDNMSCFGMAIDRGEVYVNLGAPPALDADGIVAAATITGGVTIISFAATYSGATGLSNFGRRLTAVASAAGTPNMTVTGRDYLGAKMIETIALNGTTPVAGVKAFKYIDSIVVASGITGTLNVGWNDAFGLPYRAASTLIRAELKNDITAANAGAIVAGIISGTTSTATTGDVRGVYTPATVIPDGTNTFEFWYMVDRSDLHGVRQYGSLNTATGI